MSVMSISCGYERVILCPPHLVMAVDSIPESAIKKMQAATLQEDQAVAELTKMLHHFSPPLPDDRHPLLIRSQN